MKTTLLKTAVLSLVAASAAALPLAGQAVTVKEKELHSFTKAQGCGTSSLIQGTDGNFYGTKEFCGSGFGVNSGTVFQMTPTGTVTILHTFDRTDGENPKAGVVEGPDGAFYGTTSFGSGGQYTQGTVFRITSTGDFTTSYHFTNGTDGAEPVLGLVVGQDGALYGASNGTTPALFRITTSGTLTTLYNFSNTSPNSLILGADGNFYGTTEESGAYGYGSVFKLTPAGAFTTLYSFTYGTDGAYPAGLHQNSNGDLFGVTNSGVASTLFTVTTSGALTNVATFVDGVGGVIQGSDGNYYGTIPPNYGADVGDTFFSLTPSGVMTTLFTFSLNDYNKASGNGVSALVQGTDGSFYGASVAGGWFGPHASGTDGSSHYGNLFHIIVTP